MHFCFLASLLASAAKYTQKLFYSKKMAEFAFSELDLASQPRYLTLVSIGAPLGRWSGSYIFFDIAR